MFDPLKEVWITGLGLVSSLGEGVDAHVQIFGTNKPAPKIDKISFSPYHIHPICELDFSQQIPKRGDMRQMEDWQRIGTYAAGLALDDAGIKGHERLLGETHIIAAAANGERDPLADAAVLDVISGDPAWREHLTEQLLKQLRPTLYLAQQTQLLAGNISIVHKITGGSRTFKGEELAGAQIVENAVDRIRAGQGDLFLVGASYNAARWDQLLIKELNGQGDQASGSMGAFLVIESKDHATARGAKPYARIKEVQVTSKQDKGSTTPSISLRSQDGPAPVEELSELFGHGVEAQFPLAIGLASLFCSKDASQISITGQGMSVGDCSALIEKVGS